MNRANKKGTSNNRSSTTRIITAPKSGDCFSCKIPLGIKKVIQKNVIIKPSSKAITSRSNKERFIFLSIAAETAINHNAYTGGKNSNSIAFDFGSIESKR